MNDKIKQIIDLLCKVDTEALQAIYLLEQEIKQKPNVVSKTGK